MEFLHREATAINSNVGEESVRKVVEIGALSWEMIEDQRKAVVMGRLRAIDHLDETQCHSLYRKLSNRGVRFREKIVKNIYKSWIRKCMYSVSDGFKC